MKRYRRVVFLLLILLAPCAHAQAASSPTTVIQQAAEAVVDRIQRDRRQLRSDPAKVVALVDELILPHFDFARMGRWVLGKHWRSATQQQRQRFIEEFRTLLVRTYATALFEYTDQDMNFLDEQLRKGGQLATVKMEIVQTNGNTLPIDYRMHIKDGTWKVFDVNIEGISLVTTYRASFSSEIRRNGLDEFMDNLIARNEAASSG